MSQRLAVAFQSHVMISLGSFAAGSRPLTQARAQLPVSLVSSLLSVSARIQLAARPVGLTLFSFMVASLRGDT